MDGMETVALYKNDRQIQEIRYSVKRADDLSYRIRMWVLSDNG